MTTLIDTLPVSVLKALAKRYLKIIKNRDPGSPASLMSVQEDLARAAGYRDMHAAQAYWKRKHGNHQASESLIHPLPEGAGQRRAGSTDSCDALVGPCACGSWHDHTPVPIEPNGALLELALLNPDPTARPRLKTIAAWAALNAVGRLKEFGISLEDINPAGANHGKEPRKT